MFKLATAPSLGLDYFQLSSFKPRRGLPSSRNFSMLPPLAGQLANLRLMCSSRGFNPLCAVCCFLKSNFEVFSRIRLSSPMYGYLPVLSFFCQHPHAQSPGNYRPLASALSRSLSCEESPSELWDVVEMSNFDVSFLQEGLAKMTLCICHILCV